MKIPEQPLKSGKFIYCPDFQNEILIHKMYIHPEVMHDMMANGYQEDWEDQNEGKNFLELKSGGMILMW